MLEPLLCHFPQGKHVTDAVQPRAERITPVEFNPGHGIHVSV